MLTYKPSRIHLDKRSKELLVYENFHKEDRYTSTYNIYITSDEEIKEGDWCIIVDIESVLYGQFEKHKGKHLRTDQWRKIILTTDQDLIDDGIEQISEDPTQLPIIAPDCPEGYKGECCCN